MAAEPLTLPTRIRPPASGRRTGPAAPTKVWGGDDAVETGGDPS